ncbi:MAG TPA: glycosyltransferase family A protein, partial [Solirubrobacteraceae bacterium]|nr:glycosyltransferase family A protein [Solirubrobacteraceae bacterium]
MTRPVSLILPNRNNGPVLDLALERLATHTTHPDFELIVVDDASTDGSLEILRRWRDSRRFERFKLLETAHSGVADSLNQGLAAAEGELVVSLDGDATLETPGWLERMEALLESDPRVGIVSAGIVLDTGRVHAYGVNLVGPLGMHDRPSRPTEPAGRRTLHGNVRRVKPSA